MEITIDLKKQYSSGLPTYEYIMLRILYSGEWKKASDYFQEEQIQPLLENLESLGYIKLYGGKTVENVEFRQPTIKLFGDIDKDVDSWIDDWLDLWPKGIRSGGYYVRGDKIGCTKKLKKILKQNKKITKDDIFKATKAYIDRKRLENWSYMQCAQYFIEKNGTSNLMSEIDNIGFNVERNKAISDFGTKEI